MSCCVVCILISVQASQPCPNSQTTHPTPPLLKYTINSGQKKYLDPHLPLDDAAFISIDATGADVRVRYGSDFNVERIGFNQRVHTLDDALSAVRTVLCP
jgi:hypothetical protein